MRVNYELARRCWVATAIVVAAFFIASVLYGQYINYSPVPIADSWGGTVNFYLDALHNPLAWWKQHNEHRIFFSKLFFWLDMRYFDGQSLLLIPLNIVLLLLTCWLLNVYARKLMPSLGREARVLLGVVLGMCCLSWMQSQNIIWGFQSQFIFVYLFPLLSFYVFALAQQAGVQAWRWRLLSLVLGFASAHSMANGILALPVLAVLCWYTEKSLRNTLVIACVAILSTALFFIGYEKTPGGTLGIAILAEQPLKMIGFALTYLGSPFYWISGRVELALATGVLAVLLALYMFWRRAVYQNGPMALALFAYVGYVFATAAITAFGRSLFELKIAASSRYTTPTLLMWVVLLMLLLARGRRVEQHCRWALVGVVALLVPVQMKAFELDTSMFTPQVKAVAGLSLQLNIDDQRAKRLLYPFFSPEVEGFFTRARENKVSIFAPASAYPASSLGRALGDFTGEACSGRINFSELVDSKRDAYFVAGVLEPESVASYRYVLLGNEQGLVSGVVIPGRDAKGPGGEPGPGNFDGYMFGRQTISQMRCIK